MTSSAPSSTAPGKAALILPASLTLLLWPVLMIFPNAPETRLDASWQETLVYAHQQSWQFGRDVIFTWGPWGFLQSIFHLGDSGAGLRLAWELAGKLLLAAGLVALVHPLPRWRVVTFAAITALCAHVFQDGVYMIFLTLAGLALVLRPALDRRAAVALVAGLAFLAQLKFTYTLLAAAGVAIAGVTLTVRGQAKRAAVTAAGFVAAFVAWWLLAGQNPDNIIPYFRRSWEVTTGYAAAMGMDEAPAVLGCGVALLLAGGGIAAWWWRMHPDRIGGRGAAVLLALAWFVAWKHGFTRADGHVLGFFLFAVPLVAGLPVTGLPRANFFWLALVPALAGAWIFQPGLLPSLPGETVKRIRSNFARASRAASLPATWREELARARETHGLRQLPARIGAARVDVYNYEQGVALLSGLRFAPRPVFQGYTAYAPSLARRNLRYFQSPAAPEFLLWHATTIDGRFPTLDEAWLLPELPGRYRQVAREADFLLLERAVALPGQPLVRRRLTGQTIAFDEPLAVPESPEGAIWVQISTPPTQIGRLRAALYKPPQLELVVEEVGGRETSWRLLPEVAREGFLLNPFLETGKDFAAYLEGRGHKRIKTLRVRTAPGGEEFWGDSRVDFFVLEGQPVTNDAHTFGLQAEHVSNLSPTRVINSVPIEFFSLDAVPAALLHAPAEIVFDPPAKLARLRAGFGLRPGAYTGGAHTDGVEFSVEARWPNGKTQVLWRQLLRPDSVPEDRGPHQLDVALPAGASIVLRTGPGPANNERWDWAYWTRIDFLPPP